MKEVITMWKNTRMIILVALSAATEGRFALWPLLFSGRTVHLNFSTSPAAGRIQVEAVGPEGQVLPGRGFADCDLLTGDQLDQVVSWRGQTDLGHPDGAPVTLRFRLQCAKLFSVELK